MWYVHCKRDELIENGELIVEEESVRTDAKH